MDLDSLVGIEKNPNIPEFWPGDTVKVTTKLKEGDKTRTQAFQGIVIGVRKGGAGSNFTVRRVANGVGIERIFPFYSPMMEKVELLRQGKVRRAKLNYLRGLSARKARVKGKRMAGPVAAEELQAVVAEPVVVEQATTPPPSAEQTGTPPANSEQKGKK